MIDNFSLLISHGLLALLCWRLLARADLDREPASSPSSVRPEPVDGRPALTTDDRPSTGSARTGKRDWARANHGVRRRGGHDA